MVREGECVCEEGSENQTPLAIRRERCVTAGHAMTHY